MPNDLILRPDLPPVLLLKPRDAAKILSVCERTVWKLAKAGELHPVRIGGLVRYSYADLQRWIQVKCNFASAGQKETTRA